MNSQRPNRNENKLDIGFLHASPLISIDENNGKSKVLPQLDYEKEEEKIIEALYESGKAYKFKSMVATKMNFREMMKLQPSILHISCHGITNEKEEYLIFEREDGQPMKMTKEML